VDKIKISIITTCLNSDKSIGYTLSSIIEQTYKNTEHLIVDGGSDDDTIKIIEEYCRNKKDRKIIKKKNISIYGGINVGIKAAKGDYLIILNSDDILNSKNTIRNIVSEIQKEKFSIYLGHVVYFNNFTFNKLIRFYSSLNFKPWMMYLGLMPPHPGAIIKTKIAQKNLYNPEYKIASDFDFFLRTLKIKEIKYKTINHTITRMRTGGVSGKNIIAHFISGSEIYKSLKSNKIFASHLLINLRYISKVLQFLFYKKKIPKFLINEKCKKFLRFHFKILNNVKKIDLKKNFVLSALNLAFLGSYVENKVKIYNNLIHWPDGIFVKDLNYDIKKIPGRKIMQKLKIPKEIEQITVLGTLPDLSLKYLEKKFRKKIVNKELPFGPIKKITENLKYKIKKNELILITLPTPKQEQLAEYLLLKNNYYKIICIGGSINMLAGIEIKVPDYLYPIEFLWRLRYETIRRSKRLVSTFIQYMYGKYFTKKLNNISIKIIE
tara:strand:+ start:854 stop:2329 length:1476 start_codon:yes stop_codon:yes gene_type:complete